MSQAPIHHWWYDIIDYSQTQLADPINKFSETEVILMVLVLATSMYNVGTATRQY